MMVNGPRYVRPLVDDEEAETLDEAMVAIFAGLI
jgi:hypothetical protein